MAALWPIRGLHRGQRAWRTSVPKLSVAPQLRPGGWDEDGGRASRIGGPDRTVAEQVASAIDLIVHQARRPDGARRIVEVAAVGPGPDGALLTPLVCWRAGDGSFERLPAADRWCARARADAAEGEGP